MASPAQKFACHCPLGHLLFFACASLHAMPRFQGCCSHDHDCAEEDCASAFSLYKQIDVPRVRAAARCQLGMVRRQANAVRCDASSHPPPAPTPWQVTCLNEAVQGSCRAVFKPWERRLEATGATLQSQDDDPELLLYVPFNGAINLKAISVIGAGDGRGPARMKVRVWLGEPSGPACPAWACLSTLWTRAPVAVHAPRCSRIGMTWTLALRKTCRRCRSGISSRTRVARWSTRRSECGGRVR